MKVVRLGDMLMTRTLAVEEESIKQDERMERQVIEVEV